MFKTLSHPDRVTYGSRVLIAIALFGALITIALRATGAQQTDAPTAVASSQSMPTSPNHHGLDLAVNLRGSTLGFGAEISKLVAGHMAVRAGANIGSFGLNHAVSNVDYNANLSFKNFTGLVDLFPSYHGSFHVTGGYLKSNNEITANGSSSTDGTIDLNGTSYTNAQVGVLSGKLTFPSGPYAGLGFGSPVRSGSLIRLVFDLGVVFGNPALELHASNEGSNPQLQADVVAQRAKTQSDINKYAKVFPVASSGISVHF